MILVATFILPAAEPTSRPDAHIFQIGQDVLQCSVSSERWRWTVSKEGAKHVRFSDCRFVSKLKKARATDYP